MYSQQVHVHTVLKYIYTCTYTYINAQTRTHTTIYIQAIATQISPGRKQYSVKHRMALMDSSCSCLLESIYIHTVQIYPATGLGCPLQLPLDSWSSPFLAPGHADPEPQSPTHSHTDTHGHIHTHTTDPCNNWAQKPSLPSSCPWVSISVSLHPNVYRHVSPVAGPGLSHYQQPKTFPTVSPVAGWIPQTSSSQLTDHTFSPVSSTDLKPH